MTNEQLIFGSAALIVMFAVVVFRGKAALKFLGLRLKIGTAISKLEANIEGTGHDVVQKSSGTDETPTHTILNLKGSDTKVKQG